MIFNKTTLWENFYSFFLGKINIKIFLFWLKSLMVKSSSDSLGMFCFLATYFVYNAVLLDNN